LPLISAILKATLGAILGSHLTMIRAIKESLEVQSRNLEEIAKLISNSYQKGNNEKLELIGINFENQMGYNNQSSKVLV